MREFGRVCERGGVRARFELKRKGPPEIRKKRRSDLKEKTKKGKG
jgi:hypothetical protein